MRRHATGIIAIVLLAGAAALWLWPPTGGSHPAVEAAFWRVGAVMAVLWLAWPDLHRLPAWLWGVLPFLFVLLALRPRWFIYLIPVLMAIGILRSWKRPVKP